MKPSQTSFTIVSLSGYQLRQMLPLFALCKMWKRQLTADSCICQLLAGSSSSIGNASPIQRESNRLNVVHQQCLSNAPNSSLLEK